MSNDMYDVVQIGYGPVGQTMAALLGKAGHRVAVFERWPELFGKARAGHVDHEIMRIFQSVGAADAVEEDAARATKYEFRNAAGELLLSFDWDFDGISGWPSDYIVYQPTIETALHDAVSQLPTVEIHQGWEAVAIEPQNDHVDITLRRVGRSAVGKKVVTDEERTVSARYVIGADGANSFVRDIIGTDQHDFGFQETWLVLDLRPTMPLHFDFDNGQICDPTRPHCLFQLGKRHRRFEFCLLPGETPEQMSDPATAWALVKQYGVTPDNAELVRHAVYTFKSKLADTWMDSRLLLIGDAAHVMPPFMGQGMCSGVRDANNLAWKLDTVLRGLSDPAILESYRDERAPHVSSIINMSIEAGKISCTTDPSVAAARDEAFRTGQVPPPPPFPHLESGILATTDVNTRLRGQLAPQGRIALDGREGRFDDLLGTGWTLLISGHIVPEFSGEQQATLDRLNVRVVAVADSAINSAATDIDGYYTKYFAANAVTAVLYRPDFYIFGAADDLAAVGTLIDELGSLVPPRVQAALA
ncbi:bifunctional 3-(3-hydroxy-phenyl)propionate/3-hydroxycinnamic acid hydroxylase MhpA [Rhodococcus sp. T7]|uniref:bifunctional 3-(3-hydroxy-phenyl)propionate/3-hydroxycinnamic acid hydroxylase MhpA n=1 Tax=Rhodococcus sp. T7 TaxID=627444 RepID=UPI0013579AF8|nr:bifunctional 3-(3-hydroxy-phenyl)propionate/3-hydroxycinnamic acid hydroxylase [Rhodococcus sp. T7]KAF0960211.1 3-(3-hydroxy-phenyl)propionate/3-hydroxycinnamic acid hydroxylase [Rhodococcus sp. T7]